MGVELDKKYNQLQTNKLRIDLKKTINENVELGANVNFLQYNGKKEWNQLDFIPDEISSQISQEDRDSYKFSFDDEILLDNAFAVLSFRLFDLMIGKQQVSLGTGYAWNPTDVFNVKDLIDPTYEQPGHNALRLDIPFGNYLNIMAMYTSESGFKESGKLVRIKGKMGHFDVSIIGIEKEWKSTDYHTLQESSEIRRLAGADFAGELFGLGVWSEYAYNFMENSRDFWEAVFGIDYTFDSELYLMCEYYHNSLANSDYRKYDLNDWLRYFNQEIKTVTRDQVYVFIQYPVTDLLKMGGSVIGSISDGSIAIVPSVYYSMFENVEVNIFGSIYTGKEGTAFGKTVGNGGIIRVRVFF